MILRRSSNSTNFAEVVVSSQPRRERLARQQITQIRYNDWRIQHDIGWPDADGVCCPRSVAQLAAIYRVSRQAIHDGIKVSRRVQEELEAIWADRYGLFRGANETPLDGWLWDAGGSK